MAKSANPDQATLFTLSVQYVRKYSCIASCVYPKDLDIASSGDFEVLDLSHSLRW